MNLSMVDLYYKILDFKDENIYEKLLEIWVKDNEYKNYLSNLFNNLPKDNEINFSQEDLWELYALSRVLDILTLKFQPNNNADNSNWRGSEVPLLDYVRFIELMGLDIKKPKTFETFNCEILEARQGKNNFQIIECLFPTVKFENIIIKRGGVIISLNPQYHDLTFVNNAKIYWTFRRKNREHVDLSHGWGSCSQWRTDMRIDVETEDKYIYNILGKLDLNNPTSTLLKELDDQT